MVHFIVDSDPLSSWRKPLGSNHHFGAVQHPNWIRISSYILPRRAVGQSCISTTKESCLIVAGVRGIPVSITGGTISVLLTSIKFDITWCRVTREEVVVSAGFRVSLVLPTEPAATATSAISISVCGRGTETLLALVVPGQEELEKDGDGEEETIT